MQTKSVFEDKKEIERLCVQNKLLYAYEAPVFRALFSEKKDYSVLDVGCNDGTKTVERFSSADIKKVIGLEYNSALASKAQESYGGEKFSFYCLDVESDDFVARLNDIMCKSAVKGFDVIYLSFVLMHLKDVKKLLELLHLFLNENGKILIVEANDAYSSLNDSSNRLLDDFLEILKKDRYSGNREIGANICDMLGESGYTDVKVWYDAIIAGEGEGEKKQAIFTTFFSYLPEDIAILLDAEPENKEYQSWNAWMSENYDALKSQIVSDDSKISMGVKILSADGGKNNA